MKMKAMNTNIVVKTEEVVSNESVCMYNPR